jgi:hypothetical protein
MTRRIAVVLAGLVLAGCYPIVVPPDAPHVERPDTACLSTECPAVTP